MKKKRLRDIGGEKREIENKREREREHALEGDRGRQRDRQTEGDREGERERDREGERLNRIELRDLNRVRVE